ncbi:MAG: hypothetical protein ACT4OY_07470 [Alphaproteobacteria bacterium]
MSDERLTVYTGEFTSTVKGTLIAHSAAFLSLATVAGLGDKPLTREFLDAHFDVIEGDRPQPAPQSGGCSLGM